VDPDPARGEWLYSMARALAGALTGGEVAAAVFEHLSALGCCSAGLWLLDGPQMRFAGGAGVADETAEGLGPIPVESDLPAGVAVRSGRIVTYGSRDERNTRWPRLAGLATEAEAAAVVPLVAAGRPLGCLHLGYPVPMAASDMDLPFLEGLAELCSAALDRARLHDTEHEVAHTLQRLLLPASLPAVEGVVIEARYLTAQRGAEAGGDFYDVVVLPSGRLGFLIGDVEGHDSVAAAVMGQMRSAIRALAGQIRDPRELLDALRWSWDILGFVRMATCLFGRLDVEAGLLELCSAGHMPPVVVSEGGRTRLLDGFRSPPLGAPAGPSCVSATPLLPGETLFMYTDGLVGGGRRGVDAELERLQSVLAGADLPLGDLCDAVVAELCGPSPRDDDAAVLAIRFTGTTAGA
jgi:hypothetical protein